MWYLRSQDLTEWVFICQLPQDMCTIVKPSIWGGAGRKQASLYFQRIKLLMNRIESLVIFWNIGYWLGTPSVKNLGEPYLGKKGSQLYTVLSIMWQRPIHLNFWLDLSNYFPIYLTHKGKGKLCKVEYNIFQNLKNYFIKQ